jgi:DNA-binding NtrC family response regulator
MSGHSVLIADDDHAHRRMLGAALDVVGLECRFAADGEAALKAVAERPPDLLLLDLRMPRLDGLGVLRQLASRLPGLPVVVITAHGDVRSAVEAMKLGARDFLEKPVDIEELRSVAADILDRSGSPAASEPDEPRTIVGLSEAIRTVRDAVRRSAASSGTTVLVRGESGTGKELVARAIHDLSARREGPFVAINCAAVPDGLMESELFGHERGAFTGADALRRGRFELAHGGTLFLDEIGELPPQLQAKLLRALQERTIERVGAASPIAVDIRVVAATHRELKAELAAGRLREDLYYRIAVLEIVIPPLRERLEDVLPLARHLLGRLRPEAPPRMSAELASALTRHDWPGNVRELANVLERALLFAGGGELTPEHLPPAIRALAAAGAEPAVGDRTGVLPGVPLEEVERELIEKTLAALGGNRTHTATALGLSRRALLYKIKRYGIR